MANLKLRIKTGDMVKVITGAHKGKVAKIVSVDPKNRVVKLEGIGLKKRFVKPNMLNPQGGSRDIHIGLDISKVALSHPTTASKTTRVGYSVKKDGTKVRVARQAANKEIN